ncbi:MAG TPA: hypothetical protein DDW45_07790 [Gammaproteobacteria bacterium]|nr:hypothetical protein [Gammaproteobacteria bacterium]
MLGSQPYICKPYSQSAAELSEAPIAADVAINIAPAASALIRDRLEFFIQYSDIIYTLKYSVRDDREPLFRSTGMINSLLIVSVVSTKADQMFSHFT